MKNLMGEVRRICSLGLMLLSVGLSTQQAQAEDFEFLDGVWSGECLGYDFFSGAPEVDINLSTGEVYIDVILSSGGKCARVDASVQVVLDIKELRQVDSNFYEVDLLVRNIVAVPKGLAATLLLNSSRFCGISNWKSGKAINVDGRLCHDVQLPRVGDLIEEILKIEDSQLYFGKLDENFARPTQFMDYALVM